MIKSDNNTSINDEFSEICDKIIIEKELLNYEKNNRRTHQNFSQILN